MTQEIPERCLHPVCSGLNVCEDCPDKDQCSSYGECVGGIMAEAAKIEGDYIAAGVCADCGACSLKDAAGKCRPHQCQSGEWSCAGEKLWQDEDDSDDCPNEPVQPRKAGE